MKSNRNKHTGRLLTCLALAMGMVFVHPAHVIIDHAGLIENHLHDNHDGDDPRDQASKDEICIYCLTLDSLVVNESPKLVYENLAGDYEALDISIVVGSSMGRLSARAPPISLDFLAYKHLTFFKI